MQPEHKTTNDGDLADAPLATSLRLYQGVAERVGMRSGMMDAAALCDLIAADIGRTGRDSRHRRAMVSVAKRCEPR